VSEPEEPVEKRFACMHDACKRVELSECDTETCYDSYNECVTACVPEPPPVLDCTSPVTGNWRLYNGTPSRPVFGTEANQVFTFSKGVMDADKYQWYNSSVHHNGVPIMELGVYDEFVNKERVQKLKFRGLTLLINSYESSSPRYYETWSKSFSTTASYNDPLGIEIGRYDISHIDCLELDEINFGTLCDVDFRCVNRTVDNGIRVEKLILKRV
jgi:hypothetical protein